MPGPGRHHALQHRVHVDGQDQADGRSAGPTPGRSSPTTGSGGNRVDPVGAGQPGLPAPPVGPQALGPGDDGDAELAGGDGGGRPAHQPLRGVPADGGGLAAAPGGTDPLGQLGGRGRPGPGHDVDHRQPVDGLPPARGVVQGRKAARSMRSTGVTHSERSMDSPAAMTTGMRSGSMAAVAVGGRRSRWMVGAGPVGAGRKLPSPPAGAPRRVAGPPVPADRIVDDGPELRERQDVVLERSAPADGGRRTAGGLPDSFFLGVATAGFQVEGGFNGPGQPANNWLAVGAVGRVEPSGQRRGVLGPPRGGPGPGGGPRVQLLPARASSGPGSSRTAQAPTRPPWPGTSRSSMAVWPRGWSPW